MRLIAQQCTNFLANFINESLSKEVEVKGGKGYRVRERNESVHHIGGKLIKIEKISVFVADTFSVYS